MKVLVVEDHPIVVSGCRRLLVEERTDIAVFDAPTLAEARQKLKAQRPDIVIVDVNLPDGSGLDFIRELSRSSQGPKVIVFSMSDDPRVAKTAIEYGAKGFVSKIDQPDALLAAVDAVRRGETWLSDELLQQLACMQAAPKTELPRLTKRQKDIVKCLAGGLHVSEIAADLNVSPKVVSADCAAIRQKFKARTNAEMLIIATKFHVD